MAIAGPIPVLVNADGGTARSLGDRCAGAVAEAFAATGHGAEVRMLPGRASAAAAAELATGELVVVGGGDGTLSGAAGELAQDGAGGGAALGILPLGTRNHLARDLGVPGDLAGAVRLIVAGHTRRIDLGRVNERVFVNNASIGLYPALVRRRDEQSAPKWLAALPASIGALGRMRHHRLRLVMPGGHRPVVTPLLFVGNNRYVLDRDGLGTREALDDGRLSIYAVASRRRLALVGFALRALLGRADPRRDFAAIGDTAELVVEGRSDAIDVALDGEVVRLPMPLRFRSDPGALRVIVPAA